MLITTYCALYLKNKKSNFPLETHFISCTGDLQNKGIVGRLLTMVF